MAVKFNYNSVRSGKARLSVKFNKTIIVSLSVLAVSLLIFGIILLITAMSLGWSFIGLAVIPAMVVEWYKGELQHLAVSRKAKTIDDFLSVDVLGRMPKKITPKILAKIIGQTNGGHFFAIRFGISASFLEELLSDDVNEMGNIWEMANELRRKLSSKQISAVILVVALIKCSDIHERLLNHLQLGIDDLEKGVKWYEHLHELIQQHKKPIQTGGIARDWSFGWTHYLNRFGQNISQQVGFNNALFAQLAAHNDIIDRLIGIFSKNGRQNAILVGPQGVGKTEIVHAFASRLLDASNRISKNLKFRQVFVLDSAALIAAAPGRGQLEQLMTRVLNEAYSAKNVIICLDNAQLFFEDGIGSIDISNVLLPVLEAGRLRMILTMDEQQYLRISQRNSGIANSLNRITVSVIDRDKTIVVMQERSIIFEFQQKVTYMYQALVEAYNLSERYIYELEMPGRAIKLLELSANYSDNGLVTANSVRLAIEKTVGVKVGVADDHERDKLLNLEHLIHSRMIGQDKAVSVVSDALRRARSGVGNQNRPIGTFLFLGPTGVGKTELAKALAESYFGGENNIVRIDLNEYTRNSDVMRLIADGSDNSNSLAARLIKQPFCVVLLDEIEKAHPNVLTTLLQMLDEGVLRDANNREISSRDAIIIATSNAGANRVREYIERGYDVDQFESHFINELIESGQFKSEFINRFDEIVVFRPLSKPELIQVVEMMVSDVNKTLLPQKISVSVDDDVKEYLVQVGYDPKLGARPMRRIVQRAVENTVAKLLLEGGVAPGSAIQIDLDQVKGMIDSNKAAQAIAFKSRLESEVSAAKLDT